MCKLNRVLAALALIVIALLFAPLSREEPLRRNPSGLTAVEMRWVLVAQRNREATDPIL
jgi:hypothetical protein